MKRGLLCLMMLGTAACSTTSPNSPASSTSTSASTSSGLIGQITGTGATCTQVASGSAQVLAHLHFRTRGSDMIAVLPSSFSYWVRIANPAKTKTFTIEQSVTPSGSLFLATAGAAYTAGGTNACTPLTNTVSQSPDSPGKITVTYSSVAPASQLYFAVTFSTASVIGRPTPAATKVPVYRFTTASVAGSGAAVDLSSGK